VPIHPAHANDHALHALEHAVMQHVDEVDWKAGNTGAAEDTLPGTYRTKKMGTQLLKRTLTLCSSPGRRHSS
jgi:hypothetical protein